MTAAAPLRLRRIRFKSGGTIEMMRPATFDPASLHAKIKETIGIHFAGSPGPHGCAIVLWGADGSTTARTINHTQIPGILIPNLVRNVILGNKIEDWTIDTLNGK